MTRWTRLTLLYLTFLLGIITAANLGRLPISAWLHCLPAGDKIGHFVLMGLLSFMVCTAIGSRWPERRALVIGVALLIALVSLEEVSQLWLASRRFDWGDLLADLLGIVVFAFAAGSSRLWRKASFTPP